MAAIAAQISVMPKPHRLGPADLVLSLEPLSNIWGLTMTLVALFSNSSLALTSSAGSGVKYSLVTQAVSPTIVVASAETMSQACKENIMAAKGLSTKFKFWRHARSLASGIMPKSSDAGALVRIIYISNDATADTPPLDSVELFDLKVTTGARQIYALTDANVAGAIAQTNIFDYEDRTDGLSKYSHFGPPLSSVEIYLEENDRKIEDEKPTGCLVINGPAVVGGKTKVHRMMTFTDSNTLCYSS